MEKFVLLFEEFIIKTIVNTEAMLIMDFSNDSLLEEKTLNRERLLTIVNQISQHIDWKEISEEKRSELNRQIDYIKKLDEQLLTKLQEYKIDLKSDIEKAHRQKENIKGYNLTDVK